MSNLRIILRPGIQAQPLTGSPAVPTLYVQFKEGVADVHDEELIQKMLNHPSMNKDFVQVEPNEIDPYKANRPSTPAQVTAVIENGRVVNRTAPPINNQLSPQMAQAIEQRAKEIAIQMLSEIAAASTPAEEETVAEDATEDLLETPAAAAPKKQAAKKTAK